MNISVITLDSGPKPHACSEAGNTWSRSNCSACIQGCSIALGLGWGELVAPCIVLSSTGCCGAAETYPRMWFDRELMKSYRGSGEYFMGCTVSTAIAL